MLRYALCWVKMLTMALTVISPEAMKADPWYKQLKVSIPEAQNTTAKIRVMSSYVTSIHFIR